MTPEQWILQQEGAVVCRGFLTPQELAGLRWITNVIYSDMGYDAASRPKLEFNYRRWNGIHLEFLTRYLSVENAAIYRAICKSIRRKVRDRLGRQWRFYPHRSYLRRLTSTADRVPWHIDADAARVKFAQGFNVWIPLDPVGNERPSLEYVPASHKHMRQLPLQTDEHRNRSDDFAYGLGPSAVPELAAGDALIFDLFTLHRSQPMAGDFSRTSCEFRFVEMTRWQAAREAVGAMKRRWC